MADELVVTSIIQNGTLTLRPAGRITAGNASLLMGEVRKELHLFTNVIIDASELDYISSAGIRQILQINAVTDSKKGKLEIINTNEMVEDVLETVGFLSVLNHSS